MPIVNRIAALHPEITEWRHDWERPYVLKPVDEGSSVGVKLVMTGTNHPPLDDLGLEDDDLIMAERFIPGRELAVSVETVGRMRRRGPGDGSRPRARVEW